MLPEIVPATENRSNAVRRNEKLVPVSILMALMGYAIGNYGVFLTAAWLCSRLSG